MGREERAFALPHLLRMSGCRKHRPSLAMLGKFKSFLAQVRHFDSSRQKFQGGCEIPRAKVAVCTGILSFIAIACLASAATPVAADALAEKEIRKRNIQESILAYPGNCPCPYNTDRAGRRCGGRSAHSRAGGYAPTCFETDDSDAQVREYRVRHKIPKS